VCSNPCCQQHRVLLEGTMPKDRARPPVTSRKGTNPKKKKRRIELCGVCDSNESFPGLFSDVACTYPNKYLKTEQAVELKSGKYCCKLNCASRYTPNQVRAVREYYCSLAKVDRSWFVHQRHRREEKDDDGVHVKSKGCFYLEEPGVVEKVFSKEHHGHLEDIVVGDSAPQCCRNWLAWCICSAASTLGRDATDRKRGVQENGRAPVKTERGRKWLRAALDQYEVMPNAACTVLPWRTKNTVHEAFIMEMEEQRKTGRFGEGEDRYGVDYDETSSSDSEHHDSDSDEPARQVPDANCVACTGRGAARCGCVSSGSSDEPESGEDSDPYGVPDDEEKDDSGRSHKKSLYRYGNIRLGKVTAGPVDPDLPSLTHFLHAWRSDESLCRGCVCRKFLPFAKCDICFKHRQEGYHTKDDKKRAAATKNHRKHIQQVLLDRAVIKEDRQHSARCDDELMVVAIDGADGKDSVVPKLEELTKMMAEGHQAKMHVYGCIDEGRQPRVYVCTDNVKQGHNATIQVRSATGGVGRYVNAAQSNRLTYLMNER